jgi:hypothetical protein
MAHLINKHILYLRHHSRMPFQQFMPAEEEVVEVDSICFGEFVFVNSASGSWVGTRCVRAVPSCSKTRANKKRRRTHTSSQSPQSSPPPPP